MTCPHCEKNSVTTFHRDCQNCTARYLRLMPKLEAKDYLRKYGAKHGRQAMKDLIALAFPNANQDHQVNANRDAGGNNE